MECAGGEKEMDRYLIRNNKWVTFYNWREIEDKSRREKSRTPYIKQKFWGRKDQCINKDIKLVAKDEKY